MVYDNLPELNSNPNKISVQGNLGSSVLLRDLIKIVQSDVESAKQEWLESAGKFANLLFAGILLRQDAEYLLQDSEPNFYFNPETAKYYYLENNRTVSQPSIDKLLNNRLSLARQELLAYENALINNRINLEAFQEATGKALKSLYIQNYALGSGGFAGSTDLTEVESLLNTEIDRVRRAGEAIRQQQLSKGQLSTVLSNTVGAGNTIYHQGRKEVARRTGKVFAQRFLGNTINDRHCVDCRTMAIQGVRSIEQVPMPGEQCVCSRKCKCSVVFYQRLEDAVKVND
ncbi:MAG TPA: hypothetical protein VIQ31_29655 [Phormidium sp.]